MIFPARLSSLLDDCDAALVDVDARRRIENASESYSQTEAECAVECHLASGGARADLVVRVFPPDCVKLASQPATSPPLRSFLARWQNQLPELPFVELEHDLDVMRPTPWIGPAIEPLVRRGIDAIVAARAGAPPAHWTSTILAQRVLEALGESDPRWRDRIHDVFCRLPPRGCINHLALGAARPGRPSPSVRLIVSLERRNVTEFFGAAGWRGQSDRLTQLAERVLPWESRVELDIDLELDGCAIRTATYADFRAPRARDSVLRSLVHRLVADEMVPAAGARALETWIARSDGALERVLTLKITDDGHELGAKAYLGALRKAS